MNADREYLAAGCALGTLAEAEMLEARDLEAADPTFAQDVQSFRETMGLLADSDDGIAPSADVEAAILAIPKQHAQVAPAESVSQPEPVSETGPFAETQPAPRKRPMTTLFALAASTLLVLSAVLAGALVNQQQDSAEIEDSLTAAEAERERAQRLLSASDLSFTEAEASVGGSLSLAYSVSERMMQLTPHDMPELPEDQTMQLWLIDDSGAQSAGLMTGAQTELLTDVAVAEDMTFGITVEPAGGSDEPTSEPVLLADL